MLFKVKFLTSRLVIEILALKFNIQWKIKEKIG